jgi:hypothetical protein
MNEKIRGLIKDFGKLPDNIFFNDKLDLLLIKDLPELFNTQTTFDPKRYEKDSITLQFGRDQFFTFKEDIPQPAWKINKKKKHD